MKRDVISSVNKSVGNNGMEGEEVSHFLRSLWNSFRANKSVGDDDIEVEEQLVTLHFVFPCLNTITL